MTTASRNPLVLSVWLIILAALSGGAAALAWSTQQEPRFEAVGTVFIQPNDRLESSTDIVDGLYPLDQSRLIPTYADIAASESVRAEAARRLGLEAADPYRVSARMLPDSFALEVSVSGPSAGVAEAFATEVVEIAGRRFTAAFRVYSATDLSPARATRTDLGLLPTTAVGVLCGAVAGGLLGFLLAPLLRARREVVSAPAPRLQGAQDALVGLR